MEQGEETWEVSRVPGEEKDEVSTRPDYVVLFGDDGNTGREEYENLKVKDWLDRWPRWGGRACRSLVGAPGQRPE